MPLDEGLNFAPNHCRGELIGPFHLAPEVDSEKVEVHLLPASELRRGLSTPAECVVHGAAGGRRQLSGQWIVEEWKDAVSSIAAVGLATIVYYCRGLNSNRVLEYIML